MQNNNDSPAPQQCGPDCNCKAEKGVSMRTKIILLAIIVIGAGVVLANSIIRKSQQEPATPSSSYAAALSLKPDEPVESDSGSKNSNKQPAASYTMLSSLSSLDTVAAGFDGVYIVLVLNDADKTPALAQEIGSATQGMASRGIRMGSFQLAAGTPDFEMAKTQLPPPGVIVAIKGRGMRGVAGPDISQTKLLQAGLAAMQPSSCCSAGSKRSCK
jgi:hypothetical protein